MVQPDPPSISDDLPDLTGAYIDDDRLRLEKLLGEGGFGKVYLARDYKQPQENGAAGYCAVKCLVNPSDKDDAYAKVVRRELAIHSLVANHPHIIGIKRSFLDASKQYRFVVMELAAYDLFEAIVVKGIFRKDDEKIRKAFVQILDAVKWCHDAGIAHGDIKPENVLCDTKSEHMWLTDFGLATFSRLTSSGQGSSFYMSPELVWRKYRDDLNSTNHCDIWALGVLLLNFVTQRNPWAIAKSGDKCFEAFLEDRDWLAKILPISSGLNEILKRALHLNPLCRLPLSSFRQAVLELDTFFRDTEQELIIGRMQEQLLEIAMDDEGYHEGRKPILDSPIPGTSKNKAIELRESTKAKKSPIHKFISKFAALGSPGSKKAARCASPSPSPSSPAVPRAEELESPASAHDPPYTPPTEEPITVSAPTPPAFQESASSSMSRYESTDDLLRIHPVYDGVHSSSSSSCSNSTAPSSLMAITPENGTIALPGIVDSDVFVISGSDTGLNLKVPDPFAGEDRNALGLKFGLGLAVQTREPLELLESTQKREVANGVREVGNADQNVVLDALI